jgi:hypothetical protein
MEWARGAGNKMKEQSWRGRESAGREVTIFLRLGLGGGLMWVHVPGFFVLDGWETVSTLHGDKGKSEESWLTGDLVIRPAACLAVQPLRF